MVLGKFVQLHFFYDLWIHFLFVFIFRLLSGIRFLFLETLLHRVMHFCSALLSLFYPVYKCSSLIVLFLVHLCSIFSIRMAQVPSMPWDYLGTNPMWCCVCVIGAQGWLDTGGTFLKCLSGRISNQRHGANPFPTTHTHRRTGNSSNCVRQKRLGFNWPPFSDAFHWGQKMEPCGS